MFSVKETFCSYCWNAYVTQDILFKWVSGNLIKRPHKSGHLLLAGKVQIMQV